MKFEVINGENIDAFETLVSGVREHNFESVGREKSKPLSIVARDDDNKIVGGVSGRTIYKHFLVDVVWTDKKIRGTGLGRKVMELAEIEAKNRGCVAAQVDTLSFQAPHFYEKLGFEIVGRVPEISGTPGRYFLLKNYQKN